MTTLTLSDILDDLQAAEEGLHRFERRYWISSEQFVRLYSQGQLDEGENLEDFAKWAGHYKLQQKRLAAGGGDVSPGGGSAHAGGEE